MLKNSIVLCVGAGFVAAVLSFMEHKMNSPEEFVPDYTRYAKIFVLVAGLSYGVLTLSCKGCPLKNQSGGGAGDISCPWSASSDMAKIATDAVEKIHTGNPNF